MFAYRRTVSDYYWCNKAITSKTGAHLIWSGSLSLNGMFYHTWLGYQVGIYSLVIQLIWILGFALMLLFLTKGKLKELVSSDTLHGNIGKKYGPNVQILAAIASLVTFVTLSAWELSVFERFVKSSVSTAETDFLWIIPVVTLFVAFFYTVRGGLIYNAKVNVFFGRLTFWVLIGASIIIMYTEKILWIAPMFFLFFAFLYTVRYRLIHNDKVNVILWWLTLVTLTGVLVIYLYVYRMSIDAEVLKIHPSILGLTIGWLGLFSNALFSLVWQTSEMSTWQNLTSVSGKEGRIRKSLIDGATKILIIPGLIGTIFGMSLATTSGITSSNILPKIIDIFSGLPGLFGGIAVILMLVVFFAATLSTLDGQMLASAKALIFDVFRMRKARSYLLGNAGNIEDDQIVLRFSDATLVAVTIAIGVVTYLFSTFDLFDIVYVAVIGQVSLFLPTVFMILGQDNKYDGGIGIIGGLVAGGTILLIGWLYIAPIATILGSTIGAWRSLAIVKGTRK